MFGKWTRNMWWTTSALRICGSIILRAYGLGVPVRLENGKFITQHYVPVDAKINTLESEGKYSKHGNIFGIFVMRLFIYYYYYYYIIFLAWLLNKKNGCDDFVDAKINTLESKGKCSPSHGKSTKRASQFDLKLTREKTKSNSRAYQLGFRISLRWAYRQALPILQTTKRY